MCSGFLKEIMGLVYVQGDNIRPVCLGVSFPVMGLVAGDFYVFC